MTEQIPPLKDADFSTPMSKNRKRAYLYLAYSVNLMIRAYTQPFTYLSHPSTWYQLLNPFAWYYLFRNRQKANIFANWIHNLLQSSVYDFENFEEEIFWNDYCMKKHEPEILENYWIYLNERYHEFENPEDGI